MAVDERARHELYVGLADALGPERADTMMELLPPVGWGDVATKQDLDQLSAATKHDLDQLSAATKHDLDQLSAVIELKFERTEHRIKSELRADMLAQTRTIIVANTAAVVSVGSLSFAAAAIFGG